MSTLDTVKQQIKDCERAIADAKRVVDGYQKQMGVLRQTVSAREIELARLKIDLKRLTPEAVA